MVEQPRHEPMPDLQMSQGRRTSFVVRVTQDSRGTISGVIEQVATGAKEPFAGIETIPSVIANMLEGAVVQAPYKEGSR